MYCIIIICSFVYVGITQHPANKTYCEGSNAVLKCVIFDNSTNNAANTTIWFTNEDSPGKVLDSMINNSRDGDVVTSVLTIENVSLNDNGKGYFCVPTSDIKSNVGVTSVAGDMNILYVIMYV